MTTFPVSTVDARPGRCAQLLRAGPDRVLDPEELPELLLRDVQRALEPVDVELLERRDGRPAQRLCDPARRRDRMRAAVDPEARLADRLSVGLDLEPDPHVQ